MVVVFSPSLSIPRISNSLYNCIDIAKAKIQGLEITDLDGENAPVEVKILHDLEQAAYVIDARA